MNLPYCGQGASAWICPGAFWTYPGHALAGPVLDGPALPKLRHFGLEALARGH